MFSAKATQATSELLTTQWCLPRDSSLSLQQTCLILKATEYTSEIFRCSDLQHLIFRLRH